MQNMFKLFTAVLVLGFMVGCGGGGGSSGSGGQEPDVSPSISFSEVNSVFPVFSISGISTDVDYIIKEKQYNVSNDAFDDFNASILDGNYLLNPSTNFYEREDTLTQIKYYAKYDGTTLAVQIAGVGLADFGILNDGVFDDEFGGIDGNLTQILSLVYYEDDVSSKYTSYALGLVGSPWLFDSCNKNPSTNNKYKCTKEDDTFAYIWLENDEYSYFQGAIVK